MTLRNKLLLVVLLPATVFILALSLLLSHLTGKAIRNEVFLHLETSASAAKNHLEGYFAENIRPLKLIVQANKDIIII